MSEDIQFISPNAIGYKELSNQEVETIKKAIDSTENKVVWDLVAVALWVGYIILCPDKSVFLKAWNILILVLLLAYLFFRVYGRLRRHISYICAADGYVVDREVQFQKINPKDTTRLKPYKCNSDNNVSQLTKERAFFYISVRLENGEYVRYVNCTEKDYYNLGKGDKVLVVYYGGEIIQGYKV
mgnify:FL=1